MAERKTARERMEELGVHRMRQLSALPLLLAVLAVAVWLHGPSYQVRGFMPKTGVLTSALSGVAIPATTDPAEAGDARLAYARLTWRELEPEQGEFAFEALEEKNHFDAWRASDVRLILCFCLDVPSDVPHEDLPEWLLEETERDGEDYEFDGKCGYSPDYSNYRLRALHREALAALGARYDGDGLIMAVEIGSIGHNGLWDMAGVEQALPTASVMDGYVQDYVNAFERTELTCAVRYDTFEGWGIGCLNPNVGDKELSWAWLNRNDYGGYDERIRQEVAAVNPAKSGGVWAAHIDEGTKLSEMTTADFEAMLKALKGGNASYLYGADMEGLAEDRISSLNAMLGYRLWVRQARLPDAVSRNSRLRVDVTWQNDGACAMPVTWPVELSLYRDGERIASQIADIDTHELLPGSTECFATLDVPHDAEPGEYAVTIAVLDPETGKPGIDLPMECERMDGRCVLGSVEVR